MEKLKQILLIMRNMGMKANYSELSREYGISRQTIAKYDKGFVKQQNRKKTSKLDKYKEEIAEKMALKGVTITGVYKYLKSKYPEDNIGSRSNFDNYVRINDLIKKKQIKVRPRYETPFGEQLQFDYKEHITMTSSLGEVFTFHIFTSILSASRMVKFNYSKTKTKEDTIRCLIASFEYYGGVTKELLTDNMSGIVNTSKKNFTNEFLQFAKDFHTTAKKCKIRTPETKGKVESKNRFINRLIPYNHEFETEEELIAIIDKLTEEVNNEVNATTQLAPSVLFLKEKEYLLPLPNKEIIRSYLNQMIPCKVHTDSMINYKNKRYSVPEQFVNKMLKLEEFENKLYIYDNTKIIRIHPINKKIINYHTEDYIKTLKNVLPHKSDSKIEEMARMNLAYLDNIRS